MKRLLTALALSAGFAGASFAAEDDMKPVMIELKDGVYQFHMAHYSSLVVITDEGVLVVDPNHEFRAEAMRAEIARLTDQPVVKVLYSHPHFDHSRGGQIFKDEGAEFITHAGCTELLARDLQKRVVQRMLPTRATNIGSNWAERSSRCAITVPTMASATAPSTCPRTRC